MTSYLKGKDIKQQGDCLVHCFIKNIETVVKGISVSANGFYIHSQGFYYPRYLHNPERVENAYPRTGHAKPEGFEKW